MPALNRREFLGMAAGTALAPMVFTPTDARQVAAQSGQAGPADALFDRAIVFDALSADQEWDNATFEAARVSGLSAIHTSLSK